MVRKQILLFVLIFFQSTIYAQYSFYDTDTVREVRIYFYDSNWDALLDSLYVLGDEQRILADISIDGNLYDSVGVRYKGFSSVSVNRVKNPFNIKLDYIIDDQNHQGIKKLKLSNVIHDPSFVREILSYEIARKYMPASQANYCNIFINDTLWGLYNNVESVNKSFLIKHFDSKYNTFIKGNPENINIQIGGENSNLSNTHGLDTNNYQVYYEMKSDHGWQELYNLIDTLNNFPDSISNILNIDRVLWMHAFNYTLINFDSYVGYAQNYYLYRDLSGLFNPIVWDLNMSLGSFRLTDASQLYFSGFDINQAQYIDPLTHHNYISVSPRPLMTNLFSKSRFRKMYMAHIRTILEENIINQEYFNRAQFFQNLIDIHVQNDTNKFYSYTDFTNNLNNQVNLTSSICPGITQLMDVRASFLSSCPGYSGEPTISNITSSFPSLGDDFLLNAQVNDASHVRVYYRFGENEKFKIIEMYDDGAHNDNMSGDGIFGCEISNCSNSVEYYLYADNDSAGVFSPKRAAYEYYSKQFNINNGELVINELMTNNTTTSYDNNGDFDDWIELYNNTNTPISTNNLFLSDNDSNLLKWKMPNFVVEPNSYLIIWADEDGQDGAEHANFKLSNLISEKLTLSNIDSTLIDSITFTPLPADISYARIPNGTGPFSISPPTFSSNNNTNFISEHSNIKSEIFPNPFSDRIFIKSISGFYIVDFFGRIIYDTDTAIEKINTLSWSSGVYFLRFKNNLENTKKLIKID